MLWTSCCTYLWSSTFWFSGQPFFWDETSQLAPCKLSEHTQISLRSRASHLTLNPDELSTTASVCCYPTTALFNTGKHFPHPKKTSLPNSPLHVVEVAERKTTFHTVGFASWQTEQALFAEQQVQKEECCSHQREGFANKEGKGVYSIRHPVGIC